MGANPILSIWQRVTRLRHRSELFALRIARRVPLLAIFPIFATCMFWWLAACLIPAIVLLASMVLSGSGASVLSVLGLTLQALIAIPAFVAIIFAAPWFFGWYLVACGLMFGRTRAADAKEAVLMAAMGQGS
jgi:hypothetical protein